MDPATNADELQRQAAAVMTRPAFDYFAGGADDERTLTRNVAAWDEIELLPHVLRDVSLVDTATTVAGTAVTAPVLVAPMAYQRLAHDDGEIGTARGAGTEGMVAVVPSMATVRLEDVAAVARGPLWFQLYLDADRGFTEELALRAREAGYGALVLSVDLAVRGRRRRDVRNQFRLPPGLGIANVSERRASPAPPQGAYSAELDATATPDAIEWLAGVADLPVIVKGVLRGDDAAACVQAGAAAVIVSNHGGRQLDGAVATVRALPAVVDAVDGAVDVLVDGGVRRGADVAAALSLGARAVLVGRPLLWHLALGGSEGVARGLRQLSDELRRTMALCGVAHPREFTRDLVA